MKAMSINQLNETRKNSENEAYLDIEQTKVIRSIKIIGSTADVSFYGYGANFHATAQKTIISADTTIYVFC